MKRLTWVLIALAGAAPPAAAQMPRLDTVPVATIDFYGLHHLADSTVRRRFGVETGRPLPDSAGRAAAVARLRALPEVGDVSLAPVCCAGNGLMLYVGIEERGASAPRFDPAPSGSVRLPAEVAAAGARFDSAFGEAIEHRDFAESDTAGHALMHWPAARQAQLAFVDLARRYGAELRDVLHHSASAEDRARAAQVLAYSPDKKGVVADLAAALRDPSSEVRNDAMRALALIALLAHRRPELGIQVPYEPMVALLDSPVWTDRNKASMALLQISDSSTTELLDLLRRRSLPALEEMARWQNLGHATAALVLLGRIGGLSDQAIGSALQQNDRERLIEAAAATRQP